MAESSPDLFGSGDEGGGSQSNPDAEILDRPSVVSGAGAGPGAVPSVRERPAWAADWDSDESEASGDDDNTPPVLTNKTMRGMHALLCL